MKAVYLQLGDVPALLQKLHPEASFDWKTPATALTGFVVAASKDSRYRTLQQTALIHDVSTAMRDGNEEKVRMMLTSHTFSLTADVLRISDQSAYIAIVRVLHIAARVLDCYEHLGRYVQQQARREIAEVTQIDRPHIDELAPWLRAWFDSTVIQWMEWGFHRFGELLSFAETPGGAFDTALLGVRGYGVVRAFDFHDERETEIAKDFALYNAWRVGEAGQEYLQQVLVLVKDKTGSVFPGLGMIQEATLNTLLEKGKTFKTLCTN